MVSSLPGPAEGIRAILARLPEGDHDDDDDGDTPVFERSPSQARMDDDRAGDDDDGGD